MHTNSKHRKNSGTTLLELSIVLFISSILVTGAFQAYRFTMRSANREKDKSELQSNLITFSNIIEKDIRMAGCGLPGNGLQTNLSDVASDELTLYTNESGGEATVKKKVLQEDKSAVIADATGFEPGGGICLASEGVDTIYRVITRIGIYDAGNDTIHFDEAAAKEFPADDTKAYPAVCTRYTISGEAPDVKVIRTRNNNSVGIGDNLDSLNIIPKNSAGEVVVGTSKSAAMLTVVIGGYIGTGGNRVFIADSSEVNIRNRN